MFNRKKTAKQSARNPRLGSQSKQPVFSYRTARSAADRQFDRGAVEPGKDKARLKRKLKQLPYLLSGLAIGMALLYNSTLVPNAQIVVTGNQALLRPMQTYQTAINNHLKQSISSRSKATINTKRLSDGIRQEFPEIEIIAISLPLLRHQPIIEIRLATPTVLLSTANAEYVLDNNGRTLFDKKQMKPGFDTSSLPTIGDSSGHPVTLGQPALTSHQVTYVSQLMAQSKAKQLQIESMLLAAGGEELHVRFQGVPYIVKFSFGADNRQSFGTFLATKERVEQDKTAVLEYVDVRIPERAYIK